MPENPIYEESEAEDKETRDDAAELKAELNAVEEEEEEEEVKRDDLINPCWIEDKELGDGPIGKMPEQEIVFFKVCYRTEYEMASIVYNMVLSL